MKNGISKSVLALVGITILLIGITVWRGLSRRNPATRDLTAQSESTPTAGSNAISARLDNETTATGSTNAAPPEPNSSSSRPESEPSAAVTIGGFVVDDSDSPIAEANLSASVDVGTLDGSGGQPEFAPRSVATDAKGKWQLKGVPDAIISRLTFYAEHPEFFSSNRISANEQSIQRELRAGTFKYVMSRGFEIHGIVVDENGAPITGAKIWEGLFSSDQKMAVSDRDGRFVFRGLPSKSVLLTATSKGRKPASKRFEVADPAEELRLVLEPGGDVIKGIVQDRSGAPISGVEVSPLYTSASVPFRFHATTGSNGRFIWEDAPDPVSSSLRFCFVNDDYAERCGVALKLNEENVITLRKITRVQGVVLDADSGKAITKFRAEAGFSAAGGDFSTGDSEADHDFTDQNGFFRLSLGSENDNAVRVTAEDYSEQVQIVPTNQENVTLEFHLKPGSTLSGVVVGPDGVPIAGAQATLATPGGNPVHWSAGKLQPFGHPIITTGPDGKFTFTSPPEKGGMVVASRDDAGFGSATVEQIRATGQLLLQPFGRLEGGLMIGGRPVSGMGMGFNLLGIGVNVDDKNTKTDDEGKFAFEKLPSGVGRVIREIPAGKGYRPSHPINVTIQPGETTTVSLGDSGGLVKGRARVENSDAGAAAITANMRPSAPLGSDDPRLFQLSAEPDGSFVIDSVPSGIYKLTLTSWSQKDNSSARAIVNVTVPDNPDPSVPIDLGEITLTRTARQ